MHPHRSAATPARTHTTVLAVLLAVVAVLLLGACSGGDAASEGAVEPARGDARAGAGAPEEAADGGGGDQAGDQAGGSADDSAGEADGPGEEGSGALDDSLPGVGASGGSGRRVVTSSIDVAVTDVEAAARQVRTLAERAGGEVSRESSQGGDSPRAEIELRVPVRDTSGVLADVAALGEEVGRTAESEPVETRLVDLESRTATQRAGVERIRALLGQATSLDDVLALEAELTRRQADLESVDAQRAALADLAALATVTVRLTTPEDVEQPRADVPPFLRGLEAGWDALARSTTVVLVVLGALLPFAVVVGLAAGAAVVATRRRGRARVDAGAPTE